MLMSATPPDWIPQRLMTVREVAELLQLSNRQVRRLIANRQLEAVSVGRSVRIRPEALASLLDQQ
jgi:excisionase family DNA binding protein